LESEKYEVVFAVMSEPSPFGRKKSFFGKIYSVFTIFGINFFLYHSFKYLVYKLNQKKQLTSIFKNNGVQVISGVTNVNSSALIDNIVAFEPDVIITVLGNQLFKKKIIVVPKKCFINLHSSLLPLYRGLLPSFWVLKNNEECTGVTVHIIDEGIDTGPIITQKRLRINRMSQQELIRNSKILGMEAILETLDKIYDNNLTTTECKQGEGSYFSFPTRQDVLAFLKGGHKFY
jgi:methionyl-tRNA formyltransferase